MQKCPSILFCALLLVPNLFAQQQFVTRQSLSKQFVVRGPEAAPAKRFRSERIPLDTALAAVSCERIKQAVLAELAGQEQLQFNLQNQGEGKIYAVLHSNVRQEVVITPIPTSGTLNYRIDLPNEIEAPRLIEAVTHTVLLERVNRRATERLTEIPLWLSRGISAQVQSAASETLVLQRHLPVTRERVRQDPLAEIREDLKNTAPLTFDELSWPEILNSQRAAHYDESAQLFVCELLRLKDGRAGLQKMLEELPHHPNWQVAFMRGFEAHFRHLVDVEKWWELTLVNFTGRDASRLWSHEKSIERMDAALSVPVQIRHDINSLPDRSNLTLQEIISDWESFRQKQALEKVAAQLRVLRTRVQPELVALVDDYRATLENYLHNEERIGGLRRVFSRTNFQELRQSTRARLDALDQQRAEFRNRPKPSTREEAILSALEVVGQRSVPHSSKQ